MTQNKPNKVEEVVKQFQKQFGHEVPENSDYTPEIVEFIRQALTSSYEQGREDERDRIAQIIESRQCNEYIVRTFVGKLGKVEARTYDEKTLANAVIGDILHSLKNN